MSEPILGQFVRNSPYSSIEYLLLLLLDIRDILVRCGGNGCSRKISKIFIVDMQSYMLIGWGIRMVMYRIIKVL